MSASLCNFLGVVEQQNFVLLKKMLTNTRHPSPHRTKWVKEAFGPHSALYAQTLEAGRHLCETTSESETQSRLQSELQDVQKAWERTTSLLERRQDLVIKAVQVTVKFSLFFSFNAKGSNCY